MNLGTISELFSPPLIPAGIRGFQPEFSRNSCCFPNISTFGGTYIYLYSYLIPSKFNIMNIIIYLIHLKYTVFYIILRPYLQKWRGWVVRNMNCCLFFILQYIYFI